MCRNTAIAFLMGMVSIMGCSRDQNPSAGANGTSKPATSASSQVVARTCAAMPERLLAEPQGPGRSARSEWGLVQIALAAGSIDEAVQAYERLKKDFPAESRLLTVSALQVAEALLSRTPPDTSRGRVVLAEMKRHMERSQQAGALQARADELELMVHLMDGAGAVSGEDRQFADWINNLDEQAGRCASLRLNARMLLHALDHLRGAVDLKQAIVSDRIESVLADLQKWMWREPELLRSLQDRRVQMLVEAGRANEALGEARVLLALSFQDAEAWIGAIERTALVMAAAGRPADEISQFRALEEYGTSGPDGLAGTPDDLKDPLGAASISVFSRRTMPAGKSDDAASAAKPSAGVEIQASVMPLLAGRANDAIDRLTQHLRTASVQSDWQDDLAMGYLAAGYALRDGHPLEVGKNLIQLVSSPSITGGTASIWRDATARFLNHRETVIHGLIKNDRPRLALGVCRAIANENLPADRGGNRDRSGLGRMPDVSERRYGSVGAAGVP